ncbi:MAG: hypothetical protein L0387_42265, partial [Acidobacteria bacterium]|nr:hypothetical protein [Acidobacteriota bacterium]
NCGRRPSERPPAAPRRAGRPRSQGGCVKRTLHVESVRSASETLVWLRLYTDRAHNNRKAVRKTGNMSSLQRRSESGSHVFNGGVAPRA